MTKATEVAIPIVTFLTLWFAASNGFVPLPMSAKLQEDLLPVLPWTLLVWFGSYSLGTIGWNLLTFPDCPGAHEQLMSEVVAAKADLSSKMTL